MRLSTKFTRIISALLVGALTLTGLVATAPAAHAQGWSSEPVKSTQAGGQECADFLFVGVRGSGEPDGFGDTVKGVRNGLVERWNRTGTVRQVWLDYPAVAPQTLGKVNFEDLLFKKPMPSTEYFDSADVGATRLAAVVNDSLRRCAGERLVMAGFSQGAQVITRAMALTHPGDRLVAAILLGNPNHYPGQNVRELSGSATAEAIGLGSYLYLMRQLGATSANRQVAVESMLQATVDMYEGKVSMDDVRKAMASSGNEIPPESYASTYSVCQAGDMVCDAAQPMAEMLVGSTTMTAEIDRTRPIHLGYSGAAIAPTLDAVGEAIAAVDLSQTPTPVPVTVAPVAQTPSVLRRPTWVLAASIAVGTLVVGFVLGLVRGRSIGRASAMQAYRRKLGERQVQGPGEDG
ncbi:cutinase family protein [Propionibacteriaceae bacterium G57]|uniref:cutinase family protein n=1 Tax=Aestuariimicrobium sp. G57 TaxID=3418485 RepID=UPI003DA6F04F